VERKEKLKFGRSQATSRLREVGFLRVERSDLQKFNLGNIREIAWRFSVSDRIFLLIAVMSG